jgi:hypothetical protein
MRMNFVLSAEQIVGPCAIRLREAEADAARMREPPVRRR